MSFASRPAFPVASLVAVALAGGTGCVGSGSLLEAGGGLVAPGPAAGVACRFEGEARTGVLRTAGGGVPFARVYDAHATAILVRAANALRLELAVRAGGWRLVGWSDPREDGALALRSATWLHPGVALGAGADGRVLDARPGEALVGTPRFGLASDGAVTFMQPVERWIPCGELSMVFPYRDDETADRERAALGFGGDLPVRRLAASDRAVELSLEPGGPPFVRLGPMEHPPAVRVVTEAGGFARVLVQDWAGLAVVGWAAAGAVVDAGDGGGGGVGVLGGLAGPRTRTVCVATVDVDVLVAVEGQATEHVGAIAAGTRFVRGAARADGAYGVSPAESAGVSPDGDGAALVARLPPTVTCADEAFDPMAGLFGTLTTVVRLTASVTVARGLEGVAPGARCEVEVARRATGRGDTCRAEARCGGRLLYGHLPSNGYLVDCVVDAEATPPRVVGGDDHPSSDGGDGTIRIDTTAGSLRLGDVAAGHAGAFTVEATIDSVEALPGPAADSAR